MRNQGPERPRNLPKVTESAKILNFIQVYWAVTEVSKAGVGKIGTYPEYLAWL